MAVNSPLTCFLCPGKNPKFCDWLSIQDMADLAHGSEGACYLRKTNSTYAVVVGDGVGIGGRGRPCSSRARKRVNERMKRSLRQLHGAVVMVGGDAAGDW